MTRLELAQVTLCAVDTRSPALAAMSLRRSMAGIDFGRVLLFTRGWAPAQPLPGVEVVEIDLLRSGADYSHFVMRQLPAHIRTSHVLVTQWDGFVSTRKPGPKNSWRTTTWARFGPSSRRLGRWAMAAFRCARGVFLAAGMDPRITEEHPEDQVAVPHLARPSRVRTRRELCAARAGAVLRLRERGTAGVDLRLHGPYNLPRFMDEATLAVVLDELPDDFFRSRDARRLARALLSRACPKRRGTCCSAASGRARRSQYAAARCGGRTPELVHGSPRAAAGTMSKHLDLGCGTVPRNPYGRDELFGVDLSGSNEGGPFAVPTWPCSPFLSKTTASIRSRPTTSWNTCRAC